MLWFFDREDESLRLETRYDNDQAEFVAIVTYPDGSEQRNGSSRLKIGQVDWQVRSAPSGGAGWEEGTDRFALRLAE